MLIPVVFAAIGFGVAGACLALGLGAGLEVAAVAYPIGGIAGVAVSAGAAWSRIGRGR